MHDRVALAGDIIYESQAGYLSGPLNIEDEIMANISKRLKSAQSQLQLVSEVLHCCTHKNCSCGLSRWDHFLLRETTIARHGNRLAVEFVSN